MSVEQRRAGDRATPRPRVEVVSRPLWRLRLRRAAPRYLLYATCAAGLLASVRNAFDPPAKPTSPTAARGAIVAPDLAARGYATLFARRYLSWDAARPSTSENALAPMAGTALASDAGLTLPPSGEQRVEWAEVVQERPAAPSGHVYTVAAETEPAGLVYLTVPVTRERDGRLVLAGYPAFVGAPSSAPAQPPAETPEVGVPALATVVERALRNYLAASQEELAADLVDGARVAVPTASLTLVSMSRLSWSAGHSSVLAIVRAQDARGALYTLAYEATVEELNGRWELSAIQVDPTA